MKNVCMRHAVGVMAILFGLLAETGSGASCFWTNTAASGNFEVAGNWLSGIMPGSADRAVFTNRTAYAVNIAYPVTNTALDIAGGQVTFSTPGSNYTFGSLQITNAGGGTNMLTISGATTVTMTSAAQSFLNNPTKAGTYKLVIQNGAKLQMGSANGFYMGPNGWSAGCTSMIVVAGPGSALHGASAVQLNTDGLTAMYVTNGASVKVTSLNLNKQDGNAALIHRALLVIGDGPTESLVTLGASTDHNIFGGASAPNDKVILKSGIVRSNTTETILLPNGRLTTGTFLKLFPGSTLTLAGGTLEFSESGGNNLTCGGLIRGSGTLKLSRVSLVSSILLTSFRHSTDASITNCSTLSPGTPEAPVGTIVISNVYAGSYLWVNTNCSLDFDLAGTASTQYDRLLCTNLNVYLGSNAPAVINVGLTNGWVPTSDATFDLITARKIADTNLLCRFNLPTQPAGYTWSAGIVTNTGAGFSNEVLRVTVKGSGGGTLITIW